jgi:predicted nucleotidyltransferase
MQAAITQLLQGIEAQRGVRVLYACEAGSRAYGIESDDSDYDVRFLYVHPRDAYLDLDTPRDVVELPVNNDLDINGWDIYKALHLLRKSNPGLLEWLYSPTIYLETSPTIEAMRRLVRAHLASRVSLYYHYMHMASGNYRQYIENKAPVPFKKYLYVIRPLVMLMYLDQHGAFPLSINFPLILSEVSMADDVRGRISELVARKRAGEALGMSQPDTVLNAFIDERLAHWKARRVQSDVYDRHAVQEATRAILRAVLDEE